MSYKIIGDYEKKVKEFLLVDNGDRTYTDLITFDTEVDLIELKRVIYEKIENINDRNELFKMVDKLYNKGYIDLDKKEDFEFGRLYIPREEELDFMIKHSFKVYEI